MPLAEQAMNNWSSKTTVKGEKAESNVGLGPRKAPMTSIEAQAQENGHLRNGKMLRERSRL